MTDTLPIAVIEECERVQVRPKVNQDIVREYAESFKSGALLPPIVVFQEKGCQRYVVADGRHRLAAAKNAGLSEIPVDLRPGDEADALQFALGCNSEHGLRRTKQDLLYAVGQLMTNKSLSDKYRTHAERSELLKISERYFQALLAQWREGSASSKAERRAQKKAIESAQKRTAPTPEKPPEPEQSAGSKPAESKEKDFQARTKPDAEQSTPKPAEKKPRADRLTNAQSHALTMLRNGWNKADTTVREMFLGEIC